MTHHPVLSWASLLRTVRAPFGLLIIAGIGLLVPPQTADMLAALQDGGKSLIMFHIALALLALSAWYWARTLLAARFKILDTSLARSRLASRSSTGPGAHNVDPKAFNLLPRIMYLLAVFIGLGIILKSGAWYNIFYLSIWALPLGALVYFRIWLTEKAFPPPAPEPGTATEFGNESKTKTESIDETATKIGNETPTKQDRPGWFRRIWGRLKLLVTYAPWPNQVSVVFILLSLIAFVWGVFETFAGADLWPDALNLPMLGSSLFPGPAVVLFALGMMIAPLSLLTYLCDGVGVSIPWGGFIILRRIPVMTVLLAWVLITPTWFSLHAVRIIQPSSTTMSPESRQDLGAFFKSWADSCTASDHPNTAPIQPIIVAVSGGATMAGVWGARVLSEVEMATGQKTPRIFAVSSVSGGSLGVAAYMATLSAMNDSARCHDDITRRARMGVLAGPSLAGDALGPLLGGALLTDVPRALFAPFVAILFGPERGRDSGADLELGFSRLWRHAMRQDTTFAVKDFEEPYLSLFYECNGQDGDGNALWVPRAGMPLWFANGTDLTTGNRLITAPIDPTRNWPFVAAEDVLASLDADVPISTAIHNTARFPFLSPTGELLPFDRTNPKTNPHLDQRPLPDGTARQIGDGGYFDNSGLQTALDLADWLTREGPQYLPDRLKSVRIEPIIVSATADGGFLSSATTVRCDPRYDDPTEVATSQRSTRMLSPIVGVTSTRIGHAAILVRQIRTQFCADSTPPIYHCDDAHGLPVRCLSTDPKRQHFFHFYLTADGKSPVPLNWILSTKTFSFIWNDAMQQSGNQTEAWLMRQSLNAYLSVHP
jgi:hypothetical protein